MNGFRQFGVGADLSSTRPLHDTGPRPLLRRDGPEPQCAEHADDELLLPPDRSHRVGGARVFARPERNTAGSSATSIGCSSTDIGITGDDAGGQIATIAFLGMFAAITPALISGAVADRIKFSAWAIFVPLWVLLVFVPVFKWVYGGWLGVRGSLDFAGGTAIHVNAGIAALAAVLILGKRKGWPSEASPPHSMPLVMIGTGILWFGWFGFNAGSALAANGQAAQAFMNTFLAAAAAGLVWVLVEWVRDGHPTNLGAASGIVAGLVAITPAAGYVSAVPRSSSVPRLASDLLLRRETQVQGRLRRRARRRRRPLRRRPRRLAHDRAPRPIPSSSTAPSTRVCSTAAGSRSCSSRPSPTVQRSCGRSS